MKYCIEVEKYEADSGINIEEKGKSFLNSRYFNRQIDGSIDIIDIFDSRSPKQLEFIVPYLEKQPLFEDKNLNRELLDDINEIIFKKNMPNKQKNLRK